MLDKTLIVNGIDISDCPAMNTFNIFGVDDKPCCYKYNVSAILNQIANINNLKVNLKN